MLNSNWNKNRGYWSNLPNNNVINQNINNFNLFGYNGVTPFYLPLKDTLDTVQDNRLYPSNFWSKLYSNKNKALSELKNDIETVDVAIENENEWSDFEISKSKGLNYFNNLPHIIGNTIIGENIKILFHNLNITTYTYYDGIFKSSNSFLILNSISTEKYNINTKIRFKDINDNIFESVILDVRFVNIDTIDYTEIIIKDIITSDIIWFCENLADKSIDYEFYSELNSIWVVKNNDLIRGDKNYQLILCKDDSNGYSYYLQSNLYNTYPTIGSSSYYINSIAGVLQADFNYNDTNIFSQSIYRNKLISLDYKTSIGNIKSQKSTDLDNSTSIIDISGINNLPVNYIINGNMFNEFFNNYFNYSSLSYITDLYNIDITVSIPYLYTKDPIFINDFNNLNIKVDVSELDIPFSIFENEIIQLRIFNSNDVIILDGLFIVKNDNSTTTGYITLDGDLDNSIKNDIINNFSYASVKNINNYGVLSDIVDTINYFNNYKLPLKAYDKINNIVNVYTNINLTEILYSNWSYNIPDIFLSKDVNTIIRLNNQNLLHLNGFYKIVFDSALNINVLLKLFTHNDYSSTDLIGAYLESTPNGFFNTEYEITFNSNTYYSKIYKPSQYGINYTLKDIIQNLSSTASTDFPNSYIIGDNLYDFPKITGAIVSNTFNNLRLSRNSNNIILGSSYPKFYKNTYIEITSSGYNHTYYINDIIIDSDGYTNLVLKSLPSFPNNGATINIRTHNTLLEVSDDLQNENLNQEFYSYLLRNDNNLQLLISSILYKTEFDKYVLEVKETINDTSDNRLNIIPVELQQIKTDYLLKSLYILDENDWFTDDNNKLIIEPLNVGSRKIRFVDGLTYERISSNNINDWQTNHNWILNESNIAIDAVVGLVDPTNPTTSKLKWYKGEWRNGIWKDGYWCSGVWKNGTWLNGTFDSVYVEDYGGQLIKSKLSINNNIYSKWTNGIFKNGNFKNGTWLNGTWLNGTFGLLNTNPLWKNGLWYDGFWENGTWEKGTLEKANIKNGTFETGIFNEFTATDNTGIINIGTKSSNSFKTIIYKLNIIGENITIYPGLDELNYKNTVVWSGHMLYSKWIGGTFVFGIANYVTWKNGVWLGGYKILDIQKNYVTIDKTQYDSLLNIQNNGKYFIPYIYMSANTLTGDNYTINNIFLNKYLQVNDLYNPPIPQGIRISYISDDGNTLFFEYNIDGTYTGLTYESSPDGSPNLLSQWNYGTFENGQFLNGVFNGNFKNGYFHGIMVNGNIGY